MKLCRLTIPRTLCWVYGYDLTFDHWDIKNN